MTEKNIRLINKFLTKKKNTKKKNTIKNSIESIMQKIWEKKEIKDETVKNKKNELKNTKFERIFKIFGFIKIERKKSKDLYKQREKVKELNFEMYHPLEKNWMAHQPTINLMTIGHVANGKSTTMEALSGQITMRHTSELKRNITIKLGYTSFKIFKIPNKTSPECYVAKSSETKEYVDPENRQKAELVRHFSFIDNPGHQIYMRTMLIGASVADGALLIIAANAQNCPEKQTEEHLSATTMLGLNSLVVAQNKIDLVEHKHAAKQYEQIMKFLRRNSLGNAPIVPICAIKTKVNIDALCAHLIKTIKKPERIKKAPSRLYVIRSFDVNKPGEIKEPNQFKGGVAGCVLMRGFLRVDDELEVRPGLVTT